MSAEQMLQKIGDAISTMSAEDVVAYLEELHEEIGVMREGMDCE